MQQRTTLHGVLQHQAEETAELAGIKACWNIAWPASCFSAHGCLFVPRASSIEGVVPSVFVACSADWGDVVSSDDQRGAELATHHAIV